MRIAKLSSSVTLYSEQTANKSNDNSKRLTTSTHFHNTNPQAPILINTNTHQPSNRKLDHQQQKFKCPICKQNDHDLSKCLNNL